MRAAIAITAIMALFAQAAWAHLENDAYEAAGGSGYCGDSGAPCVTVGTRTHIISWGTKTKPPSRITVCQGDQMQFNIPKGQSADLWLATKAKDICGSLKTQLVRASAGPKNFRLPTKGLKTGIYAFGASGNNCSAGNMRVTVNVRKC